MRPGGISVRSARASARPLADGPHRARLHLLAPPRRRASTQAAYESALERFHSLARAPAAERVRRLGGLQGPRASLARDRPAARRRARGGYEDWYLLDSWSAVGVLEEAAVSRGHLSAHDAVAAKAELSTGAIYRLSEGHARLDGVRLSVWVTPAQGTSRRRSRRCWATAWTRRPPGCGGAASASVPRPSTACWRPSPRPGWPPHACRRAGARRRRAKRSSGVADGPSAQRPSARAPAAFATLGVRRRDWR